MTNTSDATPGPDLLAEVSPELERAIAALHAKDHASIMALADIAAERVRQIEAEGWSVEHDDAHETGELSRAAGVYATVGCPNLNEYAKALLVPPMLTWPWPPSWWKPSTPVRNRIKAGALLVAEMARHYRSVP